jgi:hypothetical protein
MTKPAAKKKQPPRSGAKAKAKAKAKTLPLNGLADRVKRALPPPPRVKTTVPRKPIATPDEPTALFNPLNALIDSQVQIAAAMLRFSPFGFFLSAANADTPARPRKR